jgi:hypothetical protein
MRAMWLVCGLLVACAGDTKDSSTETALPPAPTGGTDTDSETDTSPPPACPYEGTWTLQSITCDGVDATASYTAAVESTTLVATASPSGGCYVEIFLASTYCTEAEEIDASALSNDVWTVLGFGISSCKPAACTFDALDAPCAVGDRAGQWSETWTLDGDTWSATRVGGKDTFCAAAGASEQVITLAR